MSRMKSLALVAAAAAVAGAWTPVFGSSLTSIGVLDTNQPYSDVRAVSQDGTYVVGESRSAGAGGGAPWAPVDTNAAVLWSASSGLVELPCPSGKHTRAHGVSVGISANAGNIIISGLHEGFLTHRYYKAPLINPASGSWADSGLAGGLGLSNMREGNANNLRSHPGNDGRWYTGGRKASDGRVCRLRGDPFVGWDGSFSMTANSVSSYGVVVGRYIGVTPSTAKWDSPIGGETGEVPGSAGVRADGFGISPSFGKSQTEDFDVQWICGQVQNYEDSQFQAFRWKRGEASMTFLGTLPGHTSSVAYTVADNGVTAGRSFISGGETAVVWDTSGTWDTNGTAQSVQALLNADGVDTSAWTRLVRVWAASDDGRVLAGFGIWAADSTTRGFVAVKTPAAPVVQISNITVSGGTVAIDFTSSNTSDTTNSFAVQQAGTLVHAGTSFADLIPAATITGSAGSFQATFPPSGNAQFYRIRRP